jgi:hypothetical protein
MPIYPAMRLRVGGLDLLVVVMDPDFGSRPFHLRELLMSDLQEAARKARLSGALAYAWNKGDGKIGFIGPAAARVFFEERDISFFEGKCNYNLAVHRPPLAGPI